VRQIAIYIMRELHQPLTEIKRMEWDEMLWIFDESYRSTTNEQEPQPIGVPISEDL
jgi:hypothetical protein